MRCGVLTTVFRLKFPFLYLLTLRPEALEYLKFHGAAFGGRKREPGVMKYGSGNLNFEFLPISDACYVGGSIKKACISSEVSVSLQY